MRSKEYLSKIRRADGLQRAVLRGIAVEGNKATFRLVTDKTYNEADVAHAKRVSAEFVPAGFTADATVFKSVPDPSAVVREISAFLAGRFPAVAAFISPEDVHAEAGAGGGRFEIGVGKEEKSRFESGGVVDAVTAYLTQNFCGVWTGGFTFKEKPEAEIEHDIPPEEYAVAPRYFKICDYSAIDGAKPTLALYIADLTGETEGVSVCGTVTYFEERQTKNGKPYFSISLNDGSGQLRATYFSKKATLEKVRSLKFGDAVCLTGNNRIFNGGLSFDVKAVDYGAPPAGFVPEPRPSRPVPARYQAVFPEPVSDYVQTDLFGAAARRLGKGGVRRVRSRDDGFEFFSRRREYGQDHRSRRGADPRGEDLRKVFYLRCLSRAAERGDQGAHGHRRRDAEGCARDCGRHARFL